MKKIENKPCIKVEYLPNEEWKPIIGYEGQYEVSSFGRVKRICSVIIEKNEYVCIEENIVSHSLKDGFKYILFINNKIDAKYKFKKSKLDYVVAKAFVENKNNCKHILHKDGDILNCNSNNLEWDNIYTKGVRFTEKIKKTVLSDYNKGKTLIEICDSYDITYYSLRKFIESKGIKIRPYASYKRVANKVRIMIMEDFNNGLKPKELSIKYGYCKRFVTDLIESEGFDSKEVSDIDAIKRKKKAISLYVKKELNCCEIAKIIGVSNRTVLEWVEQEGVKKSMSEISCIMAQKGKKHHIGIKSKLKTRFGTIRTDSTYETERLSNLDKDNSVKFVERCRFRIPFFDELNKKHHYNPDFIIHMNDGSIIVEEVKPESMLDKDFNPIKHLAGDKYCKENGYIFRIVTEKDIFKKTKK